MSFHIVKNDITKVKADAIVNTANPEPVYGNGVDYAIYQAAGAEQLLNVRKQIGRIDRGCVAVTPAFNLKAKYIIHTVGPVWNGGNKGEFDTLERCYKNSLDMAMAMGCKSIAFPLIATGTYGFPKDKALDIASDVIQKFIEINDMDVTMVVYDRKEFELSGQTANYIREYVKANYARERRYRMESRAIYEEYYGDINCECRAPKPIGVYGERTYSKNSVDGLSIPTPEKTFQEKLFEIIDERGLTGPQVYKNYVSKQVYSKIQADKDYHPNKSTAVALCLSLHLNLEQTQDLIGRAGWTLSPSSKADLVIKACILNKEYNVVNINIYLYDHGCPELQNIK